MTHFQYIFVKEFINQIYFNLDRTFLAHQSLIPEAVGKCPEWGIESTPRY